MGADWSIKVKEHLEQHVEEHCVEPPPLCRHCVRQGRTTGLQSTEPSRTIVLGPLAEASGTWRGSVCDNGRVRGNSSLTGGGSGQDAARQRGSEAERRLLPGTNRDTTVPETVRDNRRK